jgi:HK97 family phage major capsid protein
MLITPARRGVLAKASKIKKVKIMNIDKINELCVIQDTVETALEGAPTNECINKCIEDRVAALEVMQSKYSGYRNIMPLTSTREVTKSFDGFLRKGIGNDGEIATTVEIPTEAHQQLIARVNQLSPFRFHCQHVMTDANHFTALSMTEAQGADGRYTSQTKQVPIELHQSTCNLVMPYPTLRDQHTDAQDMIYEQLGLFIAAREEDGLINGAGGASGPQGVLQGGSAQIDAHLDVAGLRKMYYALGAVYRKDAVWVMNSAAHEALSAELDQPKWKTHDQSASRMSLFGNGIIISDCLPDKTPVLFGNLKLGYCVVEQSAPLMIRDVYTRKPDIEFTTTRRYGGAVVNSDAIKILKKQ